MNNELKALAKQRLDKLKSYSYEELIELLWGDRLHGFTYTDSEARKLIGMRIVGLLFEKETAEKNIKTCLKQMEILRQIKMF